MNQLADINVAVCNFATYQKQAAEFSVQKVQEIVGLTADKKQDDDVPLDTGLRTFQNFGIAAPISTDLVPVKRLGLAGATSGQYFEYPQLTTSHKDSSLFCEPQFVQKAIAKIEACVGVGIYSFKLTYSDGSCSPLFGHRSVNASDEIMVDRRT